ncbi:MAG TPA: YihY/virulence factor BrkB family protein [Vicinamibacterales bacterium]|nr:YihY/virulence factor BrkB family protein [Vicinamibacterales bacterium]
MTPERILRRARAELRISGLAAWRGTLELINSNDFTHAAAIAYYALLSLFPFLLLLISLFASVAATEQDRVAVLTFVLDYFPTQLDFVAKQLDNFGQSHVQFGVAGLVALAWASLGVFNAITSAVNHAWGVEKQRSFLKHRLVSFLMLVASGGILVIGLTLVTTIQVAEASWFGAMLGQFSWLRAVQTLTFRSLTMILLVTGVGLIFYFIPNAKTRFRDVWVGAVVTGLLWRGAFEGFAIFIRHNTRIKMVNGSIATVIVFLLWVYVSAVILMYGVEFTAAYARIRRHRPHEVPAAPSPRL